MGLDEDYMDWASSIRIQESGGEVDDPYIRTKARPKPGERGSSAWGPLQITRGLLRGYMKQFGDDLTEQELEAADFLQRQQSEAIRVGGRDRHMFEPGGSRREESKEHLDTMDYGGSLGIPVEMRPLLDSVSSKMLNRTFFIDSGGDEAEAAAQWHGGANWRNQSPDRIEKTKEYVASVVARLRAMRRAREDANSYFHGGLVDKALSGGRTYR